MEVQAITKNFRMSAQKMREVTRQVQGLPAAQALAVLQFVTRKSARVVSKTLKSAIANAASLCGTVTLHPAYPSAARFVRNASRFSGFTACFV